MYVGAVAPPRCCVVCMRASWGGGGAGGVGSVRACQGDLPGLAPGWSPCAWALDGTPSHLAAPLPPTVYRRSLDQCEALPGRLDGLLGRLQGRAAAQLRAEGPAAGGALRVLGAVCTPTQAARRVWLSWRAWWRGCRARPHACEARGRWRMSARPRSLCSPVPLHFVEWGGGVFRAVLHGTETN
jgi:hypothetical protein